MSDTSQQASSFRHGGIAVTVWGIAALSVGCILRILGAGGELWVDELWSLLHVSSITNPVEIFTKIKHDNNHLLNSLWMWVCLWMRSPTPLELRLPSLMCAGITLYLLFQKGRSADERHTNVVWLGLVAFSYPLILYCSEARGYSLTVLCAVVAYQCLERLLREPHNNRAIAIFSGVSIVGCLSHAIYVLFLTPSLIWLAWRSLIPPLNDNARTLLRYGILPPIIGALLLTFTFYKGIEIGGAPLLPYLEVAATTISVAFGGDALSSVNADATGWSLFLVVTVITVCTIELIAWIRSGDPRAILIALILATPWGAVAVLQPHFILPRYFIIQTLFLYLVAARFICRLAHRSRLGLIVSVLLTTGYLTGNVLHTTHLIQRGRSHFVEIWSWLAEKKEGDPVTVGGDQDYQNGLRMAYAGVSLEDILYVRDYRTSTESPRFIVRESLDAYEVLPETFRTRQGATYTRIKSYKAPLLNGSNVYLYEIAR
jgi:hypothetical protein